MARAEATRKCMTGRGSGLALTALTVQLVPWRDQTRSRKFHQPWEFRQIGNGNHTNGPYVHYTFPVRRVQIIYRRQKGLRASNSSWATVRPRSSTVRRSSLPMSRLVLAVSSQSRMRAPNADHVMHGSGARDAGKLYPMPATNSTPALGSVLSVWQSRC